MDRLVGPAAEDLRTLRPRLDGFWMHVSFVCFSVPQSPFVLPPVFSPSYCTVIESSLGTVPNLPHPTRTYYFVWVNSCLPSQFSSQVICGNFVLGFEI